MDLTPTGSRATLTDERALGLQLREVTQIRDAVSVTAFDRVAAAVDGSHYLHTPRAVVTPNNVDAVSALLQFAVEERVAVTFRSGGTSLSGQSSTSHVLVDTRKNFRSIEVIDDGGRVRVGPGATVRQVNRRLARYGRKLGPDPASEIACTIGGVVANNSSGMACGTTHNAYRTLESAVVVLASGTIIDSKASDADDRLRSSEPRLWRTLMKLRTQLRSSVALREEVTRQFSIKNTMGYSLNALLDHESAVQILIHLMVGSEGTLGFVAEATFRTVASHQHAATSLLMFETLQEATEALVDIVASGATAVELMDAASLRVAATEAMSPVAPPLLRSDDQCALLVEYQAATADELNTLTTSAATLFSSLPLLELPSLSADPTVRASLWRIRKGLYASIAGARPAGTTALLEDIAVPVERLAETCAGLRRLFEVHGYSNAVIFGHAKDGNVHFLITEAFDVAANVQRYRSFTEDMVALVLAAGGTLKAEHGTGKIMAPFVERQYGPELFDVMREIKDVFDPKRILNPDVVLTRDADLHLRNFKLSPSVETEVDRCVDCGYCEPVCPSKDLTTTPRQRIAVRRAIAEADSRGEVAVSKELRREEVYASIDTCAVDGMCQTACPVLINTGDLTRRLRAESAGPVENAIWTVAGRAWGASTRMAAAALTVASVLPDRVIEVPNNLVRELVGRDTVPLWSSDLPRGGKRRQRHGSLTVSAGVSAVYFAACVGSMFGPSNDGDGVASSIESLATKAGIALVSADGVEALCCGTPWKSKGMLTGYREMAMRTIAALWSASRHGELPIICDNSSCSEGLVQALEAAISQRPEYSAMTLVDAVDFASEHILPNLQVDQRLESLLVHPTCSSTRANSNGHLRDLAVAMATRVTVLDDWGCCAFAGDRGLLHPELTASATRSQAVAVNADDFDAYVSCNRTCEIGMTRATGKTYEHILEVLDRLSTPSVSEER